MKKIEHEWQHEMLEIYGAAVEELLTELKSEIGIKLKGRVDRLREEYKAREQVDARSWIKNGVKNRGK